MNKGPVEADESAEGPYKFVEVEYCAEHRPNQTKGDRAWEGFDAVLATLHHNIFEECVFTKFDYETANKTGEKVRNCEFKQCVSRDKKAAKKIEPTH